MKAFSVLTENPSKSQTELHVELFGAIDESAHFESIDSFLRDSPEVLTVFDLSSIDRINSIGVRKWLIWQRAQLHGRKVVFRNCPRAFIDQVNQVAGFLPANSVIESFFVPFHCESCASTCLQLLHLGQDYSPGSLPTFTNAVCPLCKGILDIDISPERYFGFLDGKLRGVG